MGEFAYFNVFFILFRKLSFQIYIIELVLGPYQWTIKHRYSEFYELHEKVCIMLGLMFMEG